MFLLLHLTLLKDKQTNIKIWKPPRENLFLCLLQSHLAALACFHKELEHATVNHLEDEHKNHIDVWAASAHPTIEAGECVYFALPPFGKIAVVSRRHLRLSILPIPASANPIVIPVRRKNENNSTENSQGREDETDNPCNSDMASCEVSHRHWACSS